MRIRQYINRRKISASLVIALAALLALTTGALAATGILDSIFARYSQSMLFTDGYIEDIDLQALAAELDCKPQTATVSFSNGSEVEVTLAEHFFDGKIMVLGWAMTHDTGELTFIDKTDFTPGALNSRVSEMPAWITGADKEEFIRRFNEDGFACISYLNCEQDDYVYIMNDELEPYDFADGRDPIRAYLYGGEPKWMRMEEDTVYWIDSEVYHLLPAKLETADSIDVAHHLRGVAHYYYQDDTGSYSGHLAPEWQLAQFTIERNTDIVPVVTQQRVEFPGHTADITLRAYPFQMAVTIQNNISDADYEMYRAYLQGEGHMFTNPKNLERDVIEWYNLYIDGELSEGGWHAYGNRLLEHFIVPQEGKIISLRPVYCNTGEHVDEEIILFPAE